MNKRDDFKKVIESFLILLIICLLFLNCGGGEPPPQCPTGDISDADRELWSEFTITSTTFTRFEEDFQIHEFDWQYAGYYAKDNLAYPYAKTLNAALLLENGLTDDTRQWHSAQDYKNFGKAIYSPAHFELFYMPSENLSYLAYTEFSSYGQNRILLSCNLFNDNLSFGYEEGMVLRYNNPASRAGDFVHEGTHAWQWDNGLDNRHFNNQDYYCPHILEAYDFGELHLTSKFCDVGGGTRIFHSPNQNQVEFLCDLATFSNDFVPEVVKVLARAEANLRIDTKFKNYVGFTCGDPSP